MTQIHGIQISTTCSTAATHVLKGAHVPCELRDFQQFLAQNCTPFVLATDGFPLYLNTELLLLHHFVD